MESVLRCENATLQLERETKHLMLMKAIKAYKRTQMEIQLLQKTKRKTKMGIELRFKNSYHNHTYKFPCCVDQNDENEEFQNRSTIFYDLNSNCEVAKKPLSKKTLSLQNQRRVKSQEKEIMNEEQRIQGKQIMINLRFCRMKQHFELVNRQRSQKIRKMKGSSLVKLPSMRKVPLQKIAMLDSIVCKKAVTQNSSPNQQRFAKYLKKAEESGRMSFKVEKPKKFFLQQC